MSTLDHIYHKKLLLCHVLSQQQGFPFCLAKKMQPEPPEKKAAPALGSGQQKNWLHCQLHTKSGSSRRLQLLNTVQKLLLFPPEAFLFFSMQITFVMAYPIT